MGTGTGMMPPPHNHQNFEKDYQTTACNKYKVIYNVEIVERKDRPIVMCKKEFEEKGAIAGSMLMATKQLWGTEKVVVTEIGLFVIKGLI